MESFLKLAKTNTVRNLETCGILAGSLVSVEQCYWTTVVLPTVSYLMFKIILLQKNRKFYVTALIIPKQESTSDSVSSLVYVEWKYFIPAA